MRDPKRIVKVLNEIDRFWMEHPDLRLGQIISNAASKMMLGTDPFFMEDEDLLTALISMECVVCRDRPILTTCQCGRKGVDEQQG